jgi:quinol monooxygenase YgiN
MQQGDVKELIRGGGLLVVAQWKVKAGEAEKVARILRRFLPQAQAEPGVKLFQIGQANEDPAEFLFYELFANEAAFADHQATEHFKRLIVEEALPLLADRRRTRYTLL